jgi:hypothetical protein
MYRPYSKLQLLKTLFRMVCILQRKNVELVVTRFSASNGVMGEKNATRAALQFEFPANDVAQSKIFVWYRFHW